MHLSVGEVVRNIKRMYKTDEVQNAFGVWHIKGTEYNTRICNLASPFFQENF